MPVAISDELRQLVSERARQCCEYCQVHQDDVPESHELDHIIARKHAGLTVEANLALACLPCNRAKGTDLTAFDPVTGVVVSLFNPRLQTWAEHFSLSEALVVGQTPTGRATVNLLRLNDPRRIKHRRALIKAGRYTLP